MELRAGELESFAEIDEVVVERRTSFDKSVEEMLERIRK
jgi:hypothetical protein